MSKTASKQRRQWRVRKVLKKAVEKNERPRLTVYRSILHIYAQVINDATGLTLASASTVDADLKKTLKSTHNKDAATAVG